MKKKLIVLTTGGTGGHIFPAEAVASYLKKESDYKLVFVTDKRVHVPAHWKPRAMPGFAQPDVSREITENVEEQIEKHIGDFMDNVVVEINRLDWSAFITGG